ncbi:MAG TPA: glycosyltransferase [bacterium]|nr:glycosyltransferase [bacterium]
MNLLVLTPLIPYPPHDGDKLRLYHFLKHLKSRGHKIDLFCLSRVKSDFPYEEDLRLLCRRTYVEHLGNSDLFFNLVGGVLIGQSLNVSSYFSPELRNRLKDYWQTSEGQAIDVVLAHRLRMAPAAFEYNPGKPVVLELTDCLTAYAQQLKGKNVASFSRRLAAWWDYWFLRREEVEWTERAYQSTIISESDAQVLREQGAPAGQVTVIPNGVEFKRVSKSKKMEIYPKDKPVVCFVGNMGYAANEDGALWFLKKVWPRIKQQAPSAVFAAVGGYPRKALQRHHNGRDVLVTGWVPQIEPYLVQANLSIAPLRVAAGMQNKVALSLALGVPVVATPQAVSWMPLKGRDGVIVVGNEDQFAQEVAEVLLRPKAAKAWAKKGQRFVLKNYRWNDSGKKLEQVLKQAAKRNS